MALPLLDVPSVAPIAIPSDAADVRVRPRRTRTLEAGTYGDITVLPHGTLRLTGGTYVLERLRVLPHVDVICEAPCDLRVAGRVTLAPFARLAPRADLSPADVTITIGREGGVGLHAGPRSRLAAGVLAPEAVLRLGAQGHFTGQFIGRQVHIAPRARLNW